MPIWPARVARCAGELGAVSFEFTVLHSVARLPRATYVRTEFGRCKGAASGPAKMTHSWVCQRVFVVKPKSKKSEHWSR